MSDANKAYVYALISVLCWSTVATAFKIALQDLDIYQLLFFACCASSIILLIPIIVKGEFRLLIEEGTKYWRRTLLVGMLNPVVYYIVLFAAYDRLPAQIAQPINYTWAIVLTFFSVIFLKQKPLASDYLAAFICYAGVVVIASQGGLDNFDISQLPGIALAIFSTVIWASYWVLNVNDPRSHSVVMCLNFIFALPIVALMCWTMSSFQIGLHGLLSAAYVGVFEMGLAFLFWSKALRLAENTSRVSTMIFLSPFLSLFFIHQFLGEPIYLTTYVGLVVIIIGLMIQRMGISRSDDRKTE